MIYFLRHGQSQANVDKVFAGPRLNSDLTDLGLWQAQDAVKNARKSNVVIHRIVSSPLKRAHRTAEEFAEAYGVHVEIDPRAQEYDMGLASGKKISDLAEGFLTMNEEAENPLHFQQRLLELVEELTIWADQENRVVLIVGHNGMARMLKHTARGGDPKSFYKVKGVPNCTLFQLTELR